MDMRSALAAILGLVAALAASQASADDIADFYRRQRLNLIVGNGTGGGYDVYSRVLARHMSSHIPGNPSIIVQNMPGAGGLRAANLIYNVAAKDGTVFGTFARHIPLLALIKSNQNVQFDPLKFTWLGSSSTYENDAYLLLVRDWLGFNVRIIPGYRDSGALFLAMERGEVDGRTVGLSAVRSNRPDWLRPNGFTRPLVAFGRATRHPDFPDAPLARELARDAEDRNLIEILEIPYQLSRPFTAPPGIPPDRARALQEAFLATHKDPAYLADAERLGIDVSPIGRRDVLGLIERIAKTPPDQLKRIEKLVTEGA